MALALLTTGEGWHNNHHHYQSSANQGFRWWEIDVTYYVLRAGRARPDLGPAPPAARRAGRRRRQLTLAEAGASRHSDPVTQPRPPDLARPASLFSRAPAFAVRAVVGVLAAGAAACAASAPPPAAMSGGRPVGNAAALGATLSPAEAAEEVAYYRERSAALAAPTNVEIARTDFVRLRRGRLYFTEALPDREVADLKRRLTTALGAGDGSLVLDLTGQILARNQADIRAHLVRSVSLRRTGQTGEADTQHEIAIGLIESIVRGGDGLGFASAWTVFDVSEENEILQVEGCLPRSQGLLSEGDRSFHVLRSRRFSDLTPCDFYFDVTEMMAVVARHFPGQRQ